MKHCSGCDQYLELADFGKDCTNKDGLRDKCKQCRNLKRRQHRKNNKAKYLEYEHRPEVKRNRNHYILKREYGISIDDYEQMVRDQKGLCKLCDKPEKNKRKQNLTVDHCHRTKKIRGLLCNNCNAGIGFLQENINVVDRIESYLKGIL